MVDKVPGIYAKIAKVQSDLGNIPKNGVGPSSKGGFQFVRFDDVLLAIRDQFAANDIINTVETLDYKQNAQQVGNRSVVNTSVLVKYTYIDTTDGSSISSIIGGEGSDIGGDTATRKAYTQALKIALLQTFNIVTGEEPDSDGYEQAELPNEERVVAAAPKAGSVDEVRAKIGAIVQDPESPYDGGMVNALGKKHSTVGPTGDDWGGHLPTLKKILASLEAGETA